MLTKKQRELLVYIHEQLKKDGVAPSFEEMKDALDLKSKSGIHRLITSLVERGYLQRLPNRARAIDVVRLPDDKILALREQSSGPAISMGTTTAGNYLHDLISLPLAGKIAAGTPIEAIQNDTDFISIPSSMVGKGEHYALLIEGDSMIDAGIHHGDTVIVRKTGQARDGQIVVALVDGHEATLKTLQHKNGNVVLRAENPAYEPRVLTPDRVTVQGVLTSLLRSYH